jgi:hypothetical protein
MRYRNMTTLAGAVRRRSGFKHVKTFKKDEPVVAMMEFRGRVFVATSRRVYHMVDEVLVPLLIEQEVPGK